jgi:glycosyltransferase involved in cell wall biosynthesis
MGFDLFKVPIFKMLLKALGSFWKNRLAALSLVLHPKQRWSASPARRSPLFSVCIFSYNRAEKLKRAIDSVLNQTCPEYELVVVNDGSTDETAESLAQLQQAFSTNRAAPVLKVVSHPRNRGRSAARNSAILAASGEYLIWLADDDELLPNHLAIYRHHLREDPELDILYCDLLCRLGPDKGLPDKGLDVKYDARDYTGNPGGFLLGLVDGLSISDGGSAVRYLLYEQFGHYDERFKRAQDYHFWFKVALAAKVQYVPQSLYVYYRHQQSSFITQRSDLTYEVLALQESVYSLSLQQIALMTDKSTGEILMRYMMAFIKKQEWARASALCAQIRSWEHLAEAHLFSFWKASILSGRLDDFEPLFSQMQHWHQLLDEGGATDFSPPFTRRNSTVVKQILSLHPVLKIQSQNTREPLNQRHKPNRNAFFKGLKQARQCFGEVPWYGVICLAEWADRTSKPGWAKAFYRQAWQLNPEDEISWARLCEIASAESDLAYLMERKSRRVAFSINTKVPQSHQ